MTPSRKTHRAIPAIAAVVVVAAISIPAAIAAAATGSEVAPSTSPEAVVAGAPAAAAPVLWFGGASSGGASAQIADDIIVRLGLPTGPVLHAPPPVVAPPAPAVVTEPPVAIAASGNADASSPAETRPTRGRRPSRNNGNDDRVEVEVYGATVPEPPEIASSTTTETVLVEPGPSDPWRAVRECEASGNYRTNTGNGFYGAYQFTIRTWNWVAGIVGRPDLVGVRPDRASPADQDRLATALAFEVAGGGLGHWPVCGRLYGS